MKTRKASSRRLTLGYGRSELIDLRTPITSEDVPILPGETYVFKIPEKNAKGWEIYKAKENKPEPKKFQLRFLQLNFGDGTGFDRTDGLPFNIHKKRAAVSGCVNGTENQTLPDLSAATHFRPPQMGETL